MSPTGYTVEVTNLSPNATEKDVYDLFAFCGAIQHVEIIRGTSRSGEQACTAHVTFRNPHAVETAVLLTGTTILGRPICITDHGYYKGDHNLWNHSSWNIEDESSSSIHHCQGHKTVPSMSSAQNVAKTTVAKGYMLGKGALSKAKALDESHQVSATAIAKVSNLSDRIGLSDKIVAGVGVARSVNQRYHISDTTKSAMCATGRATVSTVNSVASSSYFSKGALWLSGALNRASQVAAELGSRGTSK